MTPHSILNVDDREINRYIRTKALQAAGFRIVEASDGRSALELYRKERPSLVLLDMNLPDMSGLEVCRTMRAMDQDGAIVVHISATSTDTRHQVAGLDNGAHAYLTEPVDPSLLVATVRSLLGLRAANGSSPGPEGKTLREARVEYLRASKEFDTFAAAVRNRTHGSPPPDSVRMIANLGSAVSAADAKYKAAIQASKAASGAGPDYGLTAREREVLTLMAAGQSTKELAFSLGITFKTAACHRNRILGKFGAHNTAEVIRRAISAGLVKA